MSGPNYQDDPVSSPLTPDTFGGGYPDGISDGIFSDPVVNSGPVNLGTPNPTVIPGGAVLPSASATYAADQAANALLHPASGAGQGGASPSYGGEAPSRAKGGKKSNPEPEPKVDPLIVDSPFGQYRLPSFPAVAGKEESVHTFTDALADELGKRAKADTFNETLTGILTKSAEKETPNKDEKDKANTAQAATDPSAPANPEADPAASAAAAKDSKDDPVIDTRIAKALPKIKEIVERVISERQTPFEEKSDGEIKKKLKKTLSENLVAALNQEAESDSALKTALDVIAEARGAGSPPDPEKFKEQMRQLVNEIVSKLTEKPLPTLEKEQRVKLGRGNIELHFVTSHDGSPTTVEIINHEANVKATFQPTELDGVRLEGYEKLLDSFGRKRPETAATASADDTPLVKIRTAKELGDVYQQLVELSDANQHEGHLQFSVIDPAKDLAGDVRLMDQIGILSEQTLHLDTKYNDVKNAQELVDALTKEREQILQSGGKDDEWKVQQGIFTDSQAVTVSRHGAQTMTIRREVGEYFVDLKMPTSGGDLQITFQLNRSVEENLHYTLGKILERFSQEEKSSSLAESGIFKRLSGLGLITSMRGDKDNPAIISNANTMGVILSEKAIIEYVNFSNSALDLTGVGAKISHCKFKDCFVAMTLRDAKIEFSEFDKGTKLFGDLSGYLHTSSIRGNAYGLDASRLELRVLDEEKTRKPGDAEDTDYTRTAKRFEVGKMLSGAQFNSLRVPPSAFSLFSFLPEKEAEEFHKNFEKMFSAVTASAFFHSYGVEGLFGGAATASAGHSSVINDVIVSEKHTIDGQEVIDIYPLGLAPDEQPDDTDVFRIYLSDDDKLQYAFGKKGALRPTHKLSERAKLKCGTGNFKTVQDALHFVHKHHSDRVYESGRPVEIIDPEPDADDKA